LDVHRHDRPKETPESASGIGVSTGHAEAKSRSRLGVGIKRCANGLNNFWEGHASCSRRGQWLTGLVFCSTLSVAELGQETFQIVLATIELVSCCLASQPALLLILNRSASMYASKTSLDLQTLNVTTDLECGSCMVCTSTRLLHRCGRPESSSEQRLATTERSVRRVVPPQTFSQVNKAIVAWSRSGLFLIASIIGILDVRRRV
jgi:hypothetical protein